MGSIRLASLFLTLPTLVSPVSRSFLFDILVLASRVPHAWMRSTRASAVCSVNGGADAEEPCLLLASSSSRTGAAFPSFFLNDKSERGS
jgi:hypothetical protein